MVASIDSERCIAEALRSLERAVAGLDAEIIVVDASTDRTIDVVNELAAAVRVVSMDPGKLIPELWAAGFTVACGRVVAFTTAHFRVGVDWARALLAAIDDGATGVAGPIIRAPDLGLVASAIFYLRYAAFLDADDTRSTPGEIPGDNAAYRGDALQRHAAAFEHGFWEVDFHRRLRAESAGAQLAFTRAAVATFCPAVGFLAFARQRFEHGRHLGAWRVQHGIRTRAQILLAAAAVPLVLAGRIARRVARHASHRLPFLASVPVLLAFTACWAAGEAVGALEASGPVVQRKPVTA